MEQFKKVQVIMLPTKDNPTSISIGNQSGKAEYHEFLIVKKEGIYVNHTFQHLYFLSDNKIEEGDWVISKWNNKWEQPYKLSLKDSDLRYHLNSKKIIATTNTSLRVFWSNLKDCGLYPEDANHGFKSLPQPSQQFIVEYIEAYNAGNPITEVLVEYIEQYNGYCHPEGEYTQILKVNPDNTIIIKQLKDFYTREEVEEIVIKAMAFIMAGQVSMKEFYPEDWIKENLN